MFNNSIGGHILWFTGLVCQFSMYSAISCHSPSATLLLNHLSPYFSNPFGSSLLWITIKAETEKRLLLCSKCVQHKATEISFHAACPVIWVLLALARVSYWDWSAVLVGKCRLCLIRLYLNWWVDLWEWSWWNSRCFFPFLCFLWLLFFIFMPALTLV